LFFVLSESGFLVDGITSRIILYQQFLQTKALSVARRTCCHGDSLLPQCGQTLGTSSLFDFISSAKIITPV